MDKTKIWVNGKLVDSKDADVRFLTHSLHYGSGVFEGIRAYKTASGQTAIFRLNDHIKRLFHSAKTVDAKIPYSEKDLIEATKAVVKENSLEECYIRPLVFYGEKMGLAPHGAEVVVGIAAWSWGKYLAHDKVSVKISKFMRIHPNSSVMTAKISGHYANSILASLDAKKSGFEEALLLDYKGNVAEGPGENIFFVKGKTIYTPPTGSILPGITRNSIIKIAKDLGYKVIEKNIKPAEIKRFDEAFFTGTAVEVSVIGKIDKIIFKKSEVSQKIKETYGKIVRGEIKKYNNWLSYV